jgi:putative oxidoreductase
MNTQNSVTLAGRVLLAVIFIVSGLQKIAAFSGTLAYMSGAGLPFAQPLLVLTIAVELLGGVLLALGWKARWAAAVIFLFLIPVTAVFHNPATDPAQMVHLLKNLAIMGGMLMVVASGPGAWSLDRRQGT